MNPSSSWNVLQQQVHGGNGESCDGDGCVSPVETWPLHCVYRSDGRRHLCTSCILLANRSFYCCLCFLIIPGARPWTRYDEGDPLVAPPAPIATCRVCREAAAHLACRLPDQGAFVCPACSAVAEGRPFTYGPPHRAPLDERGSRVLLLGARLAMELLQQSAETASAEAERLARLAVDARRRANRALSVVLDFGGEDPSWNVNVEPPPAGNRRLDLGESSGTSVNAPARQQRYAMRSLAQQQRHAMSPPPPVQRQRRAAMSPPPPVQRPRRAAMSPPAPAQRLRQATPPPPQQHRRAAMSPPAPAQRHAIRPPAQQQSYTVFPPAQRRSHAVPPPAHHQQSHAVLPPAHQQRYATPSPPPAQQQLPVPQLAALTIGTGGVTQLAMAATEAARASLPPPQTLPLFSAPPEAAPAAAAVARPPTPPTLQLFPVGASSSRATPRTLQLFQDEVPDDKEM